MMVHNTITLSVLVLLAVAHHLSPHGKDGAESIFIDAHNMVGSPKQQTTTKWHRVLEITTSSPTGDGLLTNTPTTDEPSLPPTFAPATAKVLFLLFCSHDMYNYYSMVLTVIIFNMNLNLSLLNIPPRPLRMNRPCFPRLSRPKT